MGGLECPYGMRLEGMRNLFGYEGLEISSGEKGLVQVWRSSG